MPPEWIHSNNDSSFSSADRQPEHAARSQKTPRAENNHHAGNNSQQVNRSQEADRPEDDKTTRFQSALYALIGPERYQKWFAGQVTVQIEGDVLQIGVPSPFVIKHMLREFQQVANTAAQECLGLSAQVRFEVDQSAAARQQRTLMEEPPASVPLRDSTFVESPAADQRTDVPPPAPLFANTTPAPPAPARQPQPPQQPGTAQPVTAQPAGEPGGQKAKLPPRRRRFAQLDDFVAEENNHVALSMARVVAQEPGENYNPLYFYGGVGTGKTHLLEGIHSETRQLYPELTVMYLTAEAFANYYTKALREKSLPSFRRRFRSIDVLLVDDVDFLDSKKGIQEEFCHTIQELLAYRRQIVLAADRHPRMLTNIRQDLCSRFLAGLVTRLEAPDEQSRQEIVRQQAKKVGLPISPEAVDYISRKFTRSARELLGAVNCLQTYHHLTGRAIGVTATREVLKDLERDCLRIVRTVDVQRAVCDLFGVSQGDLVSAKRTRQLAQPRMVAMYLTRKLTHAAYQEIGQQFGGRNHSTVMSAERKMQQMLEQNGSMKISARDWTVQEVISMLQEQLQVG
ncbi:MAG: chromosomal replication initiator protein DnaA [Rubinisphaera brasiliensis]|uniref:chromosomal replication initiator protein DnaA n=1 Tax=Rubinisphaera brasiliensis TaxID=119 RepID=UPI00391DF5C6